MPVKCAVADQTFPQRQLFRFSIPAPFFCRVRSIIRFGAQTVNRNFHQKAEARSSGLGVCHAAAVSGVAVPFRSARRRATSLSRYSLVALSPSCAASYLLNLILQLRPDIAVSVCLGGEGAAVIVILLLDTPGQLGGGQSHRKQRCSPECPRSLLQIITRAEVVGRKPSPFASAACTTAWQSAANASSLSYSAVKLRYSAHSSPACSAVAVACRMADQTFTCALATRDFSAGSPVRAL